VDREMTTLFKPGAYPSLGVAEVWRADLIAGAGGSPPSRIRRLCRFDYFLQAATESLEGSNGMLPNVSIGWGCVVPVALSLIDQTGDSESDPNRLAGNDVNNVARRARGTVAGDAVERDGISANPEPRKEPAAVHPDEPVRFTIQREPVAIRIHARAARGD